MLCMNEYQRSWRRLSGQRRTRLLACAARLGVWWAFSWGSCQNGGGGPWVEAMKGTAGDHAESRSPKGPQTGASQVSGEPLDESE